MIFFPQPLRLAATALQWYFSIAGGRQIYTKHWSVGMCMCMLPTVNVCLTFHHPYPKISYATVEVYLTA